MHIATYTGRLIDPDNVQTADIDIRDIAHSLALQCRFNGHCRRFYSVAQHSVLVSYNCPREDQLWGLLHDAAEAYIGDMVSPIKRRLSWMTPISNSVKCSIVQLENRILAVIADRFGLTGGVPHNVAVADVRMLATEKRDLWPANAPKLSGLEGVSPYSTAINEWTNPEERFLDQFRRLTAGRS